MQLKAKNFFSPTMVIGIFLVGIFGALALVFYPELFVLGRMFEPVLGKIGDWIVFWSTLLIPTNLYIQINSAIGSVTSYKDIDFLLNIVLFLNFILAASITYKSMADTLGAFFNGASNASITARVFGLFIPLLKGRRKGKPWGVVYDSVTKQPIDPATVEISTYENGVGSFKQTRTTDMAGRFSFLVTPGKYIITADKTHYIFPSKIVKGVTDGSFENVYHGEVVEVTNPYIINLNIPMDPVAYDWNQAIKFSLKQLFLDFFKERGRPILIFFGAFTCILGEVVFTNGLFFAIFAVYLFNLLFLRVYIQKELWGTVRNKLTGQPAVRVVVKAIRQPMNVVVGSATTDYMGRYFLLMSQGMYTLQVEAEAKVGEKPRILAKVDNLNVKSAKAVINLDITV